MDHRVLTSVAWAPSRKPTRQRGSIFGNIGKDGSMAMLGMGKCGRESTGCLCQYIPVDGVSKIFDDILQCLVVFGSRRLSEARQEGGGISDVDMANNIRIDDLAKDLAVTVSNFLFEHAMFYCTFEWTLQKRLGGILCKGNRIMMVALSCTWFLPTVSL